MRNVWQWYAIAGSGLVVVLAGVGLWFMLSTDSSPDSVPVADPAPETDPEPEAEPEPEFPQVLGQSVEGRDIDHYRFGTGDTHVLLVGGVHGGYEWNSII